MDPLIIFIGCCAALLLALLTGFFGYKLARFLLPLSGLLVLEGAIYVYVYGLLNLDTLSTWLFVCGTCVAVYLILFFLGRVAGFFTGLLGSGLLIVYIVYAAGLHGFSLLYPVALTVSVMAGLLTAAYKRVGVIVSTSVLGGCAASYIGFFIYMNGMNVSDLTSGGNLLAPLESFLTAHLWLIGGAGLGLALVCLLVQLFVTGHGQVLAGRHDETVVKTRKKRETPDDADTWTGDMGY